MDIHNLYDGAGCVFLQDLSDFKEDHVAQLRDHNDRIYGGTTPLVAPEILGPLAERIAAALRRPNGSSDVVRELLQAIFPRFKPSIIIDKSFVADCITICNYDWVGSLPPVTWLSPVHWYWARRLALGFLQLLGPCPSAPFCTTPMLSPHLHSWSFRGSCLKKQLLPQFVPARSNPLDIFHDIVPQTFRVASRATTLGNLLPRDCPSPRAALSLSNFIMQRHGIRAFLVVLASAS